MQCGQLDIPDAVLREFCRRWQIVELALFGSALRTDFRPDTNVDFLVTYAPDKINLPWGERPEVDKMEKLLRRKVDWLSRDSVETGRNTIFKREVLSTAEVIYAESAGPTGVQ